MNHGQYTTYTMDGIHVPADYVAMRINSASIGGAMGLLFMNAQMSQRIKEWRLTGPDGLNKTFAVGHVPQRAIDIVNKGLGSLYAIPDDSWSAINLISVQTQQQRRDTPEVAAQKALNEASARVLSKGKCRTAIEDLLRKAALLRFNAAGGGYDKLSPEAKAAVDNDIATAFSAEAFMASLNRANPVYKPKDLNLAADSTHVMASIGRPGGVLTLTFYAGFYGQISDGKTGIRLNDEKQEAYVSGSTSLEDRALSVIHEGIHAFDPNFTDGFIGRILKGKNKDLSKEDGSKAINEFVDANCR
jgi:hypothetical protein